MPERPSSEGKGSLISLGVTGSQEAKAKDRTKDGGKMAVVTVIGSRAGTMILGFECH